jgi:hypothetical protein
LFSSFLFSSFFFLLSSFFFLFSSFLLFFARPCRLPLRSFPAVSLLALLRAYCGWWWVLLRRTALFREKATRERTPLLPLRPLSLSLSLSLSPQVFQSPPGAGAGAGGALAAALAAALSRGERARERERERERERGERGRGKISKQSPAAPPVQYSVTFANFILRVLLFITDMFSLANNLCLGGGSSP